MAELLAPGPIPTEQPTERDYILANWNDAVDSSGGTAATGPHYVLVGYNDNGTPCAALTVYAASAGLDAVKANGVLMFHDAGHPHVKSVEAISWPARR